MSDPTLELQAAIVAKLKADSGVQAVVGAPARVYAEVPENATFPYVSLGPVQVLPDKADCIDGTEVFFTIDVWARDRTYPMDKKVGKAVVAALDDQSIGVTGYDVIVFELNSINYLLDPDGITRHGAIGFRILIQTTGTDSAILYDDSLSFELRE